jgi:hypothetical protein
MRGMVAVNTVYLDICQDRLLGKKRNLYVYGYKKIRDSSNGPSLKERKGRKD